MAQGTNVWQEFLGNLIGKQKEEEKPKEEVKYPGEPADKQPPKRLIIDAMQSGVEGNYYWLLRFMENKDDFGLKLSGDQGEVIKLKDYFAAGESSSIWGSIEQRKSLQQEKVSGYLATVGKMTKDIFQILRELRIIDERLDYYDGYNKGDHSTSVALKSVWVDLVEGGAKNPGSVTGLAAQVGFVILPDLFYRIHPKNTDDIPKLLKGFEKDGINKKVLEVLGRKLAQFIIWKIKTEKELRDRDKFTLAYLRQHFNVIRTYISWLKPYLKNIRQLQMGSSADYAHLVTSFETNMVELELLGKDKKYTEKTPNNFEIDREYKKYFPCIHVRVRFVALPEMAYQKEYQRGAIHLGRTEIFIQPFVCTNEQIEAYKRKIEKEDFEVITSLESSLDSLKDELFKYLEKAEEKNIPYSKEDIIEIMEMTGVKKDQAAKALKDKKGNVKEAISSLEDSKPQDGILDPFKGIFNGFKEILNIKPSGKALPLKQDEGSEKEKAKERAKQMASILYEVYKKAHGMSTPI